MLEVMVLTAVEFIWSIPAVVLSIACQTLANEMTVAAVEWPCATDNTGLRLQTVCMFRSNLPHVGFAEQSGEVLENIYLCRGTEDTNSRNCMSRMFNHLSLNILLLQQQLSHNCWDIFNWKRNNLYETWCVYAYLELSCRVWLVFSLFLHLFIIRFLQIISWFFTVR